MSLTYTITGKIIDQRLKGIFGLTIEAWDKDLLIDDFLGKAISNKSGDFLIDFKKKYHQDLFFDRKPDVYFKVFEKGKLIHSTLDRVMWNVDDAEIQVNIELERKEVIPPPPPVIEMQRIGVDATSKPEIKATFNALTHLNYTISEAELNDVVIGDSAREAIKAFQQDNQLETSGKLDAPTVEILNTELVDIHFLKNKTRIAKLHKSLERLGYTIDQDEKKARHLSVSTRNALDDFASKNDIQKYAGKITEELFAKIENQVIKEKYTTKSQIGILQKQLLRIGKIGKLAIEIDSSELKNKAFGKSTSQAVKTFQKRYNLTSTGELDRQTLERMNSVLNSQPKPVKLMKKASLDDLNPIKTNLRLNKTGAQVQGLQQALNILGYSIELKEFNTSTFGKSTELAVKSFQKQNGLFPDGKVEQKTKKKLNLKLEVVKPGITAVSGGTYRVKGSVRDELLKRAGDMVIKVYERKLNGTNSEALVTKKNHKSGFFDLGYTAPIDPITGQIKENFHLEVQLFNNQDELIATRIKYGVAQIQWFNFNLASEPYQGTPLYFEQLAEVTKKIGDTALKDIKETEENAQITLLSKETRLPKDSIMRLIFSELVAENMNHNDINGEVIFGFIKQNFPARLPSNLLRATLLWDQIDLLVEDASGGIVFSDSNTLSSIIDSAIESNLVSLTVKQNKQEILDALAEIQNTFTLEKPILAGNGTLKSILEETTLNEEDYTVISRSFINNGGTPSKFWEELTTEGIDEANVMELRSTIDIALVAKSHIPTVHAIKMILDNPENETFKKSSDIAKYNVEDWVGFINDSGSGIPDNMPGDDPEEQVLNYAISMESAASGLYPAVSLVARIKQGAEHPLSEIDNVQAFIDEHVDMDFKRTNLDRYRLDNELIIEDNLMRELKTVQRVHKYAIDSDSGAALMAESLHNSYQIYRTGKNRVVSKLKKRSIPKNNATRIYERAKSQYAQIIARFTTFNKALNNASPEAVQKFNYESAALEELLGDVPNLEALFGSTDSCECKHCESLYGPAAYFTDLLRFLGEHDSLIDEDGVSLVEEGGTALSVQELLLIRRPDLGNIKLNCQNAHTALPYIDLVCEILENYIAPQQNNFSHQTTLTTEELEAIPEYIRPEAYNTLATANYPMNDSFNLWQEEIRLNLAHFKLSRWDLMETFQNTIDPTNLIPTEISIAAEYFEIPTHELNLILTPAATVAEQDVYWGIDTNETSVSVDDFMDRTKLTYTQIMELLLVKFVNDPDDESPMIIDRPSDSCDLDVQTIINLTVERFDILHRFLRLWRRTDWEMWELDLLLLNANIGDETLEDESTIISLKAFKQVQNRLKLSVEVLMAFYGDIITETRVNVEQPQILIPSVYQKHFLNITITNPTDANFELDLDGSVDFETDPVTGYSPVPTILSALSIRQEDFDLIVGSTDGTLTLESLSTLFRMSYLAKGLKESLSDLDKFYTATGISTTFDSPQATLAFIEQLDLVNESGMNQLTLEYILHYNEDSALGQREETIVQYLESLRSTLVLIEELQEQLAISELQKTAISAVDTATLVGMSNANATLTTADIRTALTDLIENFTAATFAVDEASYIIAFEDSDAFSVTVLIAMIDALQTKVTDLYDNGNNQIISLIAGIYGMGEEETGILLNTLISNGTASTFIEILSDTTITEKDGDDNYTDLTFANFTNHFNTLNHIHKISVLQEKLQLTSAELAWFIDNQAAVNVIDLESLPILNTMADASFSDWINTYKFIKFRSRYPEPEDASLIEILENAIDDTTDKSTILELIAKLTQWDLTQVEAMDAGFGFRHTPGSLDYTAPSTYERMQKVMIQAKITGVEIATMYSWVERDDLEQQKLIASQTKFAIKSKYDNDAWLDKISPIQNQLRTRKRSSLVAYHLDHSQRTQSVTFELDGEDIPNPLYWYNSNVMYKYFLIDVEMGPDQLTSRLKQAISSVQFFVQRCFLNLEQRYVQVSQDDKEDVASENSWSQWKWMKSYRIWEANRKVFFYPENWIEPELRDDKSPFFTELEDEILQGDMTHDNVEAAYLNYLQKVDEVAHLEVCGTFHEYEDLNDEYEGYEINQTHVIAKTKDDPGVYYYRLFDMNYFTWTAWEKIDVDITGDHAVPVVYNRKLHIFWLTFIDKPQKVSKTPAASASSGPTDSPEPLKVLELQLGWTVKKHTGWTPKSISSKKLIHPWERPYFAYNLKPFYKSYNNELWLDVYISTSREFNSRKFYDPHWQDSSEKYAKLTHVGFDETYRPWHSSSFVFNGKVSEIKMNALAGKYRLISETKPTGNTLYDTNSVNYVQSNFSEDGRNIQQFGPFDIGPNLDLPTGMHYHNNHLRNNIKNNQNSRDLNILANGSTKTLLKSANGPFDLVIDQQDIPFDAYNTDHPFFYQDSQRALFIQPQWQEFFDEYGNLTGKSREYGTSAFYHPYTTMFIRELNRDGIDGLLTRKVQTEPDSFTPGNDFSFTTEYSPTSDVVVDKNVSSDVVDFSLSGAYSIYNWETFFHAPLLIANRLMQNQRFEEAMRWFHYIFDPTNIDSVSSPERYWITKPFFEHSKDDYLAQQIQNILNNIDSEESQKQLIAWRNDPFKPHLIARYRPVAYQRNVVMKYIDNLIAWGDQLFRRDTMESINEAALLYMLAHEILGDRPEKVPNVEREELTFNELPDLDDFANARVDIAIEDTLLPMQVSGASDGTEPLPNLETLYFCIPSNDFMLKYWDTVADRMFKIRNSMNIEGVKRSLALFAPPIDPALLVKAAAAGMDLSTVLNDISAGTPHYRFRIVVQKAVEFCLDVKALGDKLLAALQSKDAEELALIRAQHEIQLLEGIKLIKEQQINEAVETLGGLQKSKTLSEIKETYYDDKEYMNAAEIIGFSLNSAATAIDAAIAIGYMISGGLSLIPDFLAGAAGFGGTPEVAATMGGQQISNSAELAVKTLSSIGAALQKGAGLAETQGSYQRRMDEWEHQKELATVEIEQIQFQINAAMIRQSIAEIDLENQEDQIVNSEEVYDYMKNKYTNEQLYSWMITRISTTYFQAYQLAFEMAKKAEKCYQYELGLDTSSFIQFGYWDSLKKGLLSGENLLQDLRRLESSYMDLNKRELEITKSISLAQMAPLSLINLKQNGECTLTLPEWLFDMDYPGHYMRRIKSVSVSIPCVVGPYTSINCTLSLTRHETRINALLKSDNYEKEDADDDRFRTRFGAVSSIATSHAQNDSGLFELNFNDDRYLPFEGAGLDSDWILSMPLENNYFDFSTITDIVIHVNYTARNGGETLGSKARTYVESILPSNSMKLISLKHEFSNEWYQLFNPEEGDDQEFSINLTAETYPFFIRNKLSTWKINSIDWFIQSEEVDNFSLLTDVMNGSFDALPGEEIAPSGSYDGIHHWNQDLSGVTPDPTGVFKFKIKKTLGADFTSLTKEELENIFIVIHLE